MTMDFIKPSFVICIAILFIFNVMQETSSSRILTVAPFYGKSHSKFVQAVTLHLARQGHEMTVITTNLVKDPPANYHQIPVNMENFMKEMAGLDVWQQRNDSLIKELFFGWNLAIKSLDEIFNSPAVKDFNENDKSHFDLVIVEMFFQEAMYMFAHKYKAPLVLLETSFPKRQVEDFMGNPALASYVPFEFSVASHNLSLIQRAYNWFICTVDYVGRKYHVAGIQNAIIKKHFKHLPGPLPTVDELENSVDLVLVNSHFSFDVVYPLVPGIVQIGGAHIEPVKKLPENIQKFLDGATDGAIYFGLGSHLYCSKMPKYKINAFVNVFKSLKQRVIWKWEDDNPPKLDNLLTGKWLPQNDILAHPNVKVFINHGGMLGTQEAIDKGVPVIAIPIFADQYLNTAKLVSHGVAVELDYLKITEGNVRSALDQIFNVSSYGQMAKELSKKFRDRPSSPLDTATYWIEYVIRHKGGQFLKSPAARMPWYKRHMIDVMLVAAGILGAVFYAIMRLRNYSKYREEKRLTKVILNEKYKRS